jgi:uncharacterized protein YdbL (DUF1318 family)
MTARWTAPWTRRTLLGLIAAASVAAFPLAAALADELDDLRASGVVAERFDGYVMLKSPGSGPQGVVDKVNAERRAIYEERAKQQGVAADQVGQVYAAQIMGSAPSGTWFLGADGNFVQKP